MLQESPGKEFREGPALRILLVEDDALVRRHVTRMLAGLGHTIHPAQDGHSALEALAEKPGVDLLFTDVVMPGGMDGVALAETVRKSAPSIPVLLTSGYADLNVLNGRTSIQGAELLGKPYRLFQLREKLEILFGYSAASSAGNV